MNAAFTHIRTTLGFLACTLCLVSCGLEADEENPEDAYDKSFIKKFGLIDSEQDWNLATRANVTVTTPSSADVKVYALFNGKYKLVAHYEQVSGTRLIEFDALRETTNLLVIADNQALHATVGGEADFTSQETRTITEQTDDSGITTTKTGDYKYFLRPYDYDIYEEDNKAYTELNFESLFPVGKDNSEADGVTVLSAAVSTHATMKFYPVYWNTSSSTWTFGIAYEKNGEKVQVPFYTVKDGKITEGLDYAVEHVAYDYWQSDWADNIEGFPWGKKYAAQLTADEMQTIIDYMVTNKDVNLEEGEWWGFSTLQNTAVSRFSAWKSVSTTQSDYDQTILYKDDEELYPYEVRTLWRSAGVQLTVPQGLYFSFYVTDGTNTYYSNSAWNPDSSKKYVAYGKDDDGNQLLGFDLDGDQDFADLIFAASDYEVLPDGSDGGDAFEWILAAEDLGGTDDFDFNDIVFSVKHVSGETTATVTPLAAGGTMYAYICYNGSPIGANGKQEIHTWFGVNVSNMYNTTNYKGPAEPVTITVPADFSMTTNSTSAMGGFTIEVQNDNYTATVTAPGKGSAPQMICVPASWQWPTERTRISDAYPDFGTWGENYGTSTEWYAKPASSEVVVSRE